MTSMLTRYSRQKVLVTTIAIGFEVFVDVSNKENNSIADVLQNGRVRILVVVAPAKVVKAMVDMLLVEVWNSKTIFLIQLVKVVSS